MQEQPYPILEYDPTREAIIEPSRFIEPIDIPERCVLTYFLEVIAQVCAATHAPIVYHMWPNSGNNPVYALDVNGEKIAVTFPGVGGPLAALSLEGLIARGCRKFIACGGAGVLDRDIAVGHVIVPTSAVRDEGTSYHYLPPGREVAADPRGIAAIEATLRDHDVNYLLAKTWTTDAVYRETPRRIAQRKAEGCLTVEMEAATFFAVARFRGVAFGQLLYGGDDVSGDEWDTRDWHRQASTREKLFWLAVEAALKL